MSIAAPPTPFPPQPPSLPVRRFTVDEYHRMIQAGILTEDDNVELLEGLIVPKMSRNPPHDGTIELADDVLRARLPAGWKVRIQSAITTVDSEPEPDLAIVAGPARRYLDHHPGPSEIAVVVEVADSTLQRDRGDKYRLYARAGIACYWIVNLIDGQVEVYTEPTGPADTPSYRQQRNYRTGEAVPFVVSGQVVAEIAVADLLPDAPA